ncbi:MAG: sensor domain-containing diguanylate cyclase [Vicinamibacteria bacterium]|nr:sensor domain-containing diguanylate cyclase [Vicinamibacteria bacterium]
MSPDALTARRPIVDIRTRWRAGIALSLLAVGLAAVAWWRPLAPAAHPRLRLSVAMALAAGTAFAALLASLRGRGPWEHRAFLAFLALALDGVAQAAAPWGWPGWPLLALLVGAAAVSEPLGPALGLAALCGWLGFTEVRAAAGAPAAQAAAALGFLALALAVNRALRLEQVRFATVRAELERVRHGLDQLDELAAGASTGPTLSLRQVSEDGRRARGAERATELETTLEQIVSLARAATSAHALLLFDVDRRRDVAVLRCADGPESLAREGQVPLGADPFGFVLQRNQPFYATDFPRLLHALPWYRSATRIGTLLAQPVLVGEAIAAVLVADRVESQALNQSEPELLRDFAALIGRALWQARESLAREELGTEFRAVYQVSSNLAKLGEAGAVQRVLLNAAHDLVPTLEAAAFVTADETGTAYTVDDETLGWPREFVGRQVAITETTWAAWMLRSTEEAYLLESVADERKRMPVLVLDEDVRGVESLLALPLRSGDPERSGLRAALLLMARRGTFTASVTRVLGVLANQAGATLVLIRQAESMKEIAARDGLTGLYNRRAFEESLARALANADRTAGRFAVMLLDVDHFKKLNDTYGHPAGDAALRHVAKLIGGRLRQGDLAARYGGEEFVAILPGADADRARQVAERAREALANNPVVFEGATIKLTASFGVGVWPGAGRTRDALIGAADAALYEAKQGGRNRVVVAVESEERRGPEEAEA